MFTVAIVFFIVFTSLYLVINCLVLTSAGFKLVIAGFLIFLVLVAALNVYDFVFSYEYGADYPENGYLEILFRSVMEESLKILFVLAAANILGGKLKTKIYLCAVLAVLIAFFENFSFAEYFYVESFLWLFPAIEASTRYANTNIIELYAEMEFFGVIALSFSQILRLCIHYLLTLMALGFIVSKQINYAAIPVLLHAVINLVATFVTGFDLSGQDYLISQWVIYSFFSFLMLWILSKQKRRLVSYTIGVMIAGRERISV